MNIKSAITGLALMSLLLAPALGFGQTVEEFPLRAPLPANTPNTTEEVTYRHNGYDDHGFNRMVQKITVPTLTVFRPARSPHRGAAMIVCPGGGYSSVVIDKEGYAMGRYFAERGITVVVLKYRLPDVAATKDGLPYPQQDALAAMQWVRSRAAEWGIDPQRIGILGCSAGGHLAGSVGILGSAADGSRPDFVALLYPVVCMEGPNVHQGSRTKLLGSAPTPERVAEFSLEKRTRAGLPPFFLVHAGDDKGVPPGNSELLTAALRKAGVPAELMLVATGGHGFGLGRDAESVRWKDAFLTWLDRLP
ncbi:MAG: alpha/beta hydrolase [Opitutaceae bacterium]|nr:alpha/beta hydrolase [Opitutaceae bacterium]